jgi:glyoxylate/hydroxypyruvate reductase
VSILIASSDPVFEAEVLHELAPLLPHEEVLALSAKGGAASTALRQIPHKVRESVDVAVVASPPTGIIGALPHVRFIQSLWAGVDGLLADTTLPHVPTARLVDPMMTQSMVESVLAHVLSLHLDLSTYRHQQARAQWKPLPVRTAADTAVGILGLGELGTACATQLVALGFPVLGWARSARAISGIQAYFEPSGLAQVLSSCNIVVNLLPLTDETWNILSKHTLSLMRPGAGLINVGRGAHVVDDDLLAALDAGHLKHAILDVFHVEPLPDSHPYWSHPKVTVMPHVAASTNARSACAVAAANIQRFRSGQTPHHLIDRSRRY